MSDEPAYVDNPHQRSPWPHVHVRDTDQCIRNEDGPLCPSWQERAERAEAALERAVTALEARGWRIEAERVRRAMDGA